MQDRTAHGAAPATAMSDTAAPSSRLLCGRTIGHPRASTGADSDAKKRKLAIPAEFSTPPAPLHRLAMRNATPESTPLASSSHFKSSNEESKTEGEGKLNAKRSEEGPGNWPLELSGAAAAPATHAHGPSASIISSPLMLSPGSNGDGKEKAEAADGPAIAAQHAADSASCTFQFLKVIGAQGKQVSERLEGGCKFLQSCASGLALNMSQLVGVGSGKLEPAFSKIVVLMQHGQKNDVAKAQGLLPLFESALQSSSLMWTGFDRLKDFRGNNGLHTLAHALSLRPHSWAERTFLELVKRGCDINGRDLLGQTPLHASTDAFELADSEVTEVEVRLLQRLGADLNAQDDKGDTMLHLAIRRRLRGLVVGLFNPPHSVGEFDFCLRNKQGQSILQCALTSCAAHPKSEEASDIADALQSQVQVWEDALRNDFKQHTKQIIPDLMNIVVEYLVGEKPKHVDEEDDDPDNSDDDDDDNQVIFIE